MKPGFSPLLLSWSDLEGGAARGSFALHQALLGAGVQSRLRVATRHSGLPSVHCPAPRWRNTVRRRASRLLLGLERTDNAVLHSLSLLPSGLLREPLYAGADLIHLHWVCGELLSIAEIGRIDKPLIWTLRDMWPFCGAEHYAPDGPEARWRGGYARAGRMAGDRGLDLDRWTWQRKRRAWQRPMQIVALSTWLADCARHSALMRGWPVCVIPNALDVARFSPRPRAQARQQLGLPPDRRLILFGAIGGSDDPRKGWDLLEAALRYLAPDLAGLECVVFGQDEPPDPPRLGMPIHWMGRINDDDTLAQLYSAADVMVVPSRQEAFGKTASEPQACGCPVVAFGATGLLDVVDHQATGYLARPFDPADLAHGIAWVLGDPERHHRLGAAARQRAVRLWAPDVVVRQYLDVYERALQGPPAQAAPADPQPVQAA